MPAEKVQPLGDVADLLSGGTPSKSAPEFWSGNIPWLTPKDMGNWTGATEEAVSDSAIGNGTRLAPPEASFIAVRGMSLHNEIRIVRAQAPIAFNQDIKAVVPRAGIQPEYLFQVLVSKKPELLRLVEAAGHGTGRLPTDQLLALKVPRFGSKAETAIAEFMGALDDKIDLNRRMSDTLERMARAIFRSWFVDFDPVRAKMEGRETGLAADVAALFPERFGDSGLPEGWETRKIGELPVRIAMGPFGSRIKTENFTAVGVPVIRGGNLTDGFVDDNFVYVTPEKAEELRSAAAFPGDIVITHRGTLGQVGKIPSRSRFDKYIVSQSQMLLGSNNGYLSLHYIFEFLRSVAGLNALLSNTTTTGVPAIGRPSTSLRAIELIYPPEFILVKFDQIMQALEARQVAGKMESETLAALRNVLLPKLMSGDVRIRDAEKLVDEAGG
ncbi:restriction endonuclease subunit S [Granulibacter bethesdensis]|nr:restriction endonuclease subunit S [Granulibacter bethesdensis]